MALGCILPLAAPFGTYKSQVAPTGRAHQKSGCRADPSADFAAAEGHGPTDSSQSGFIGVALSSAEAKAFGSSPVHIVVSCIFQSKPATPNDPNRPPKMLSNRPPVTM